MFDPMPQPKKNTMPPAIVEWQREQRMLRIKVVLFFIFTVVCAALLGAWAGHYIWR